MKTLTIEGHASTIDGILFHHAEHADLLSARVFTAYTPALVEQINASGLDPLKPIRAVLTLEQGDDV